MDMNVVQMGQNGKKEKVMIQDTIDKDETNKESSSFIHTRGCPISHLVHLDAKKTLEVNPTPKLEVSIEEHHSQLAYALSRNSMNEHNEEVNHYSLILEEILQLFFKYLLILHLFLVVYQHVINPKLGRKDNYFEKPVNGFV